MLTILTEYKAVFCDSRAISARYKIVALDSVAYDLIRCFWIGKGLCRRGGYKMRLNNRNDRRSVVIETKISTKLYSLERIGGSDHSGWNSVKRRGILGLNIRSGLL